MTSIFSWHGGASTGAVYKLEITEDAGVYTLASFSTGAGAPRKSQGASPFSDRESAIAALLKKAREKRAGRERAYVLDRTGALTADLPKLAKDGTLAAHPQLTQGDDAAPVVTSTSTATSAPIQPLGPSVALCKTITDPEPFLRDLLWIATRKIEGQRAMLHVRDGQVVMTNRSGGVVACSPQIAQAAAGLPDGTLLDGELVALDENGREALYVGGLNAQTVFVAFDLLAFGERNLAGETQNERLMTLAGILPHEEAATCIRIVEVAATETDKRVMLDTARAQGWEGMVFRRASAPYTSGRSGDWVRFKLRRAEIDLVVMGYSAGKGQRMALVGAVQVGLYDGDMLVGVGEVGGGWDTAQLAELTQRRDAGIVGYVITAVAEGFTAQGKLIRPSGVAIRADGDKLPTECRRDEVLV